MRDVRSAAVRGDFHKRLIRLLNERIAGGAFTQESLAKRVEMHQTTVSGILRRNAGTFDLDEAAAALDHAGAGTLASFAEGLPPVPATDAVRLTAELETRPELRAFVEDLLPVPKPRLDEVLELARGLARLAIVRRGGRKSGSTSAHRKARRTTAAPKKRR